MKPLPIFSAKTRSGLKNVSRQSLALYKSSNLNKVSSTGVRSFSSPADSQAFNKALNGEAGIKINLNARLASLVPSYEEVGTYQTRTSPYQDEDTEGPHDVTLSKMLAAGLHLGSSTKLWNPLTQPFIFGERAGIHIFNLEITLAYLRRACNFTREVAANGGLIVFLSSKPEFSSAAINAAISCNGFYIYDRWIPGTITNRDFVLRPVMVKGEKEGEFKPKYYKPDLIIVANYADNRTAILEATKMNVPTIALIDSDQDPTGVTYPIPGNDDSVRGLELVFGLLSTAAQEGLQKRQYIDLLKARKETKSSQKAAESLQ